MIVIFWRVIFVTNNTLQSRHEMNVQVKSSTEESTRTCRKRCSLATEVGSGPSRQHQQVDPISRATHLMSSPGQEQKTLSLQIVIVVQKASVLSISLNDSNNEREILLLI